ncbi:hypothetical protein P154DRAFT_536697 [Amniculicola lignicola CBS 123094]|uniref:YTH domain-containing protein n=1 Tax=Amniculicola lignicola CBS 123094 TaxID=1392246 RepID=A0A6A5W805_9PLEO|nr:hypothetical protein P154DRAFT_536697 [Amniculicola lignicola CBS 123094]
MAFVWVQQWFPLPIIFEGQMGDLPPGSVPLAMDAPGAGLPHDETQHFNSPPAFKQPGQNAAFYAQLSSIPQSTRHNLRSPTNPTNHHHPVQDLGPTPLNMGPISAALPEYGNMDGTQSTPQAHLQSQRPLSDTSPSILVYQYQHNLHGHSPNSLTAHSPYGPAYGAGQYPQNFGPVHGSQNINYGPFNGTQQRLPGPTPMQSSYQGYQQASQYLYYPPHYAPQGQYPPGFPNHTAQPIGMYGRRPSLPSAQMPLMGQNIDVPRQDSAYSPANRMFPGGLSETGTTGPILTGLGFPPGASRSGTASSIPRGPPRKPKQSGHALWVGNLPPATRVEDLKDHFSRDATEDIESVFLISKSNCAFVNYRTEGACTAAMHRFHDSRFHGVRLVCRLRRSSAPASGVPTGPSAMVGTQPPTTTTASPPTSPQDADGGGDGTDGVETDVRQGDVGTGPASTAAERYFVVKSLTLQDLELSVRNGVWATQSHNEEGLNKAFESADQVYLIFSANKSGEYFGYARMVSPILQDATLLIGAEPKPDILDSPDVPRSTPTRATEFAPKGRIIDDSARGTIFWEADLSDSEEEVVHEKEETQLEADGSTVAQGWGKPFKVEWISTNRLPFYRTRGLRNPWNANREVKIARDGTELETSVGERLVQMFHRLGPSNTGAPMMSALQLGMPHMRPY